jgi:hypothetical protein
MRDTELYRHVLGLESPWDMNRVELWAEGERIDVWVDHSRGTRWMCPDCDRELPTYDHAEEREWRHLDICQFLTFCVPNTHPIWSCHESVLVDETAENCFST